MIGHCFLHDTDIIDALDVQIMQKTYNKETVIGDWFVTFVQLNC
jgi:hypothetical protein